MIKTTLGQIYINTDGIAVSVRNVSRGNGHLLAEVIKTDGDIWHSVSTRYINDNFSFVPQNDLEWLAVNEPEWFHDDCDFIRRNSSDKPMYTSNPNHVMNVRHDYAARPQWQNERYRLGLDTKPHYKLINGQWSETK